MNNLQLIDPFTETSNLSSKILTLEEIEKFFVTQLETQGRYSTSFEEINEICEINSQSINQHPKLRDLCFKTLLVALDAEAERSILKLSEHRIDQILNKILSFYEKGEEHIRCFFSYIAFSERIKFSSCSSNTLEVIQNLIDKECDREKIFNIILVYISQCCTDDQYFSTNKFYQQVRFLACLLKMDSPEDAIRKFCLASPHVKIACELFWRTKSTTASNFSSCDIELIRTMLKNPKMSFSRGFDFLVEFSKMKVPLENLQEIFTSIVFSRIEEIIEYLADEKISFDKAFEMVNLFQKWKTPQPLLQKIFVATFPQKIDRLICSEEQVLSLLIFFTEFPLESYQELLSASVLKLLSRSCLMFKKKLNLESLFFCTLKGINSMDRSLSQRRMNENLLKTLFPLLEYLDIMLVEDEEWRESILFFFLAHLAGNSFLQTDCFLTALNSIMLKFKLKKFLTTKVLDVSFIALLAFLSQGKSNYFSLQEYIERISPSQNLDKRILFFLKKYKIINSVIQENLVVLFKNLDSLLLPKEEKNGERRQEFLFDFLTLVRDEEVEYRLIEYVEQEKIFETVSTKTLFLFFKALSKIKSSHLSLYVVRKIFSETHISKKIRQEWLLTIYKKMISDQFVDLEILNDFFSIVKKAGVADIFSFKGVEYFKAVVRKAFCFSTFEEISNSCSMEKRFSLEILTHYGLPIFLDIEAILIWLEDKNVYPFIQILRQDLAEKLENMIAENLQENTFSELVQFQNSKFYLDSVLALLDAFLLISLMFEQPSLLVKQYTKSISTQFVKMEFSYSMIDLLDKFSDHLILDEKSKELAKLFFYAAMSSSSPLKKLLDPNQLY